MNSEDVRRLRGRILQELYNERNRDYLQTLDCEDLANRINVLLDRLQREVVYLEEKGYVVERRRQVGTSIFSAIHITAKGIDVLEGMVSDWSIVTSAQVSPSARGKKTIQVFLSYASEDEDKIATLYQKLSGAGFKPWMDKKDILPGEDWKSSIQRAIRKADFFLACLSTNSVKKRGWFQREVKGALDVWPEMLDSDIYLIPVRLDDCEVPERLRDFQWVNLFETDGWEQLFKAIQIGIERRR